jgi:glycosyltransferase involved in cell wall biosynthesis
VESILRLEDDDCEVVISDNDSSEDVAGYVASLGSPNVVYVRTPKLLPVAENWSNALEHASGDYIIMLGDDDALMPDYFSRTRQLIADFDEPEVIYHNALCYAHPDVIPEHPEGYLRSEGYARFLRGAERPFRLAPKEARSLVQGAMSFRVHYAFNIQFVTFSRSIIEALAPEGSFFRSPFPDYYGMNHLFACAQSIVVEPHPLVVIGVTARSFGFFQNNRREADGRAFLEGKARKPETAAAKNDLLPGASINDGWLHSMEELHRRLGSPKDLVVDYRRYRRLQIIHVYHGHYLGDESVSHAMFDELRRRLSLFERLLLGVPFTLIGTIARMLPARARHYVDVAAVLSARQFPWWDPVRDEACYRDIIDVIERVDGNEDPLYRQTQRGSPLRAMILRRVLPG